LLYDTFAAMVNKLTLTIFLCISLINASYAQDTLKLTLKQSEKLFLENNYQLLAQRYQTDQAKAEIITAKLFDNPELSYENLFFNHETRRFLETSMASGQFNAEISQLIKLAGKRNKNIQLANAGVKVAEYAFFDVMRTLRYELRTNFYKAYYAAQSAAVFKEQIVNLEQLLRASEQQLKSGNIALKDILRIRSLVYALKAEQNEMLKDQEDLLSQLKLMTNIKATTILDLVLDPSEIFSESITKYPYSHFLELAKQNRADLQLSKSQLSFAEQNLKLQKAMAIPDLEIALSYDLKGNYPEKYTGLGIKIPLPLFNRNQGEIKKARIAIDAGVNDIAQQESILENEVNNSYRSALRIESISQSIDPGFSEDYKSLIREVTRNFKNRNISLIEFLDLYDSYKEHVQQSNRLRFEQINAKEEINYVTGSEIFK
jgi:cobalt-zinc-cadmium efflux system outer membrane protein